MALIPSKFPWYRAGIFLLVAYFAAGLIYTVRFQPKIHYSDEREYLVLSDHLLDGPGYSMDGVHLTAARPPGYAFFIAAVRATGAGVDGLRIVQYALIAGTILLVCRFWREETRFSGLLLIVTALVAIYPVLFYTSSTLYPQTLAGFLFVMGMALLIARKRGVLVNLTTGLIFGLLVLTVPTFALTVLVALGAAWGLRMVRWYEAVLVLIGVGLCVGVWTARNALLFHQFVPLASNSGVNFLIGNCENTTPSGGSGNVDRTRYQAEVEARGLNEFEADKFYRHAAIEWIAQNPGRALVLYLEKAVNYFGFYNQYAPENQAEVSVWKQTVMALSYFTLLALLAWRLFEVKRFPLLPREKLFLLIYVLSAFTMAIFLTRIRFRLPYDYLIIAVIALHVCRHFENRIASGQKK